MYVINYPLLDASKILHEDGSDYHIFENDGCCGPPDSGRPG